MLTGIDGRNADLPARSSGATNWPLEYREEDIELDEDGWNVYRSVSWQNPLDALHEGGDGVHTKVPMPPFTHAWLEKPERPLERFCSEQQRHEKIALMMSGGRDEAHTLKDIHGPKSRAPEHYGQHDHISPTKGCASKPSPHSMPPSPPFQPYLEVDGNDINTLEGGEEYGEDDSHFEALRIAARIRTERVYRRGQRECREGRVRKKIRMARRAKEPTCG